MFTPSKKLLFIVASIVLLLALVLVWQVYAPSFGGKINFKSINNPLQSDQPVSSNNNELIITPTPPSPELAMRTLAMVFTERYGTHSTDSGDQYIKDIQELITPFYRVNLDQEIKATKPLPEGAFYGVTTKALSAEIKKISGDSASVIVNTQRQERSSRVSESNLTYQKLTVALKNVNNKWLVEGAVWGKTAE